MIIDYIDLENFISHSGTRVEFAGGINVILGNNGTGKSSMMDGIRFALFGDSGRGNNSDLIHHGSGSSRVKLGFHINEDNYEITRKISLTKGEDSKTDAEMLRNSEIYASGAKAVTAAVESLFRISRELFFNSIFVRQGEIDQLVSERPADRKKLFSQIIGIDGLQKKAEVMKSLERRIRNSSEAFIVHLEDLKAREEELESRKKELEKILDSVETSSKAYEKEQAVHGDLGRNLDQARSIYIARKERSEDFRNLKKEMEKGEITLGSLKKKKGEFAEIEEESRKIESNSIYIMRDVIKSAESDLREANAITDQLKDLARRLQEIKKLKEKAASLEEHNREYEVLSGKTEKIESLVESGKAFLAEYNLKSNDVEKRKTRISEISARVKEMETEIPVEISGIERKTQASMLSDLHSKKSELSSKMGSLKQNQMHIKDAQEQSSGKKNMLQGQNKCPVCGTELRGDHLETVLLNYDRDMEQLEQDMKRIEGDLNALTRESEKTEERIKVLNSGNLAEYLDLKDELYRLKRELDENQQYLVKEKDRFEKLANSEKEMNDARKKIRELEKDHSEYMSTKASLSTLESENTVKRIEDLKNLRDPIEKRYTGNLERAGITVEDIPEAIDSIRKMEERMRVIKPSLESNAKIDILIRDEERSLEKARENYEKLEFLTRELPEAEKKFNDLKEQYEKKESDLKSLKSSIDSLNGTLKQLTLDIKDRENEISGMEKRQKRYNAIQEALKSLSEIRTALEKDGIQKYLRKESSEAITGKTRSLVSEFGLEIDDIRVSEDFDVEVSVGGSVESLSSLSGGEKTALAIALRLSVADYVMNRISSFIMDEPTTFLDEDRRGQLKNILQNSLRDQSVIPQLIIITHHQELTKAADMVYMVRKEDGSSVVEPVE